ncbi:putative Pyroglutamylated RFamide peptide receptor [Hypsibius exemplaris]|uniref:Pyroglutamylated RFamide peptide receptor n=1 Tax=Hypsibius exemplaris TaxID=2072580 RepID=A0A1W0WTD6_HYPEX|nr:putative Pyroglutamylated RFamide peptide receptor [Hypsibius exemplaris]
MEVVVRNVSHSCSSWNGSSSGGTWTSASGPSLAEVQFNPPAANHNSNCSSSGGSQDINQANWTIASGMMTTVVDEVDLGTYPDFAQLPAVRVAFVVLYTVIVVLTFSGNVLVVYTVTCQKKMHNSVNYLICNLAVSDILVGAFVAPLKLLELIAPAELQLLNSSLCTTLSFTQSVAIFSTILTLLVISLERFYVIVYPLRSRRFSKKFRTKVYIALTWLVAAVISLPNLLGSTQVAYSLSSAYGSLHVSVCVNDKFDDFHPNFRKGYFLFLFIVVYCLPMLIIIVTSCVIVKTMARTTGGIIHRDRESTTQRQTENRRKVAMMMIIVSLGFAICWSPYFFVTVIVEYIHNFFPQGHFFFTMLLINVLGFLNSCINPFIYVMNDRFREQYHMILHRSFCLVCIKMGWMSRLQQWRRRSTTTFSQISITSHRRRFRDAAVFKPTNNGNGGGGGRTGAGGSYIEERGQLQLNDASPGGGGDLRSVSVNRLLSITSDQVYAPHTSNVFPYI